MARRKTSEFRSYPWIIHELKGAGWNTRNPNTTASGEVWTQGEVLNVPSIQAGLGGTKPENTVRVTPDEVWIIEAKGSLAELSLALQEAREYAESVNSTDSKVACHFISGVAGDDEDEYVVETQYLNDQGMWEYVRVDSSPLAIFPRKEELRRILNGGIADLAEVPMAVSEVVDLAGFINRKLHAAKIDKSERAVIVAISLLALEQDPDLLMKGTAKVFVNDINARAQTVFESSGRLNLWDQVKIRFTEGTINTKGRALSDVIERLKESNILHSVKRTDVLGAFFESFLKYGNTSKDLGIVLTPRHICWMAASSLAIGREDVVYDPAAGTGGFLVAAFNSVEYNSSSQKSKEFAVNNLFATEVDSKVATLAFANMHFRGDGKHNLNVDSCFGSSVVQEITDAHPKFVRNSLKDRELQHPAVTRVMMNPPFSQDDAESEIRFIDHALDQLESNGLLFAVIPSSVMYESQFSEWRDRLLRYNTLSSVVLLPYDLFYPASTETLGIFLRKGRPHDTSLPVLWLRISDDGFMKKKSFRVERPGVNFQTVLMPYVQLLKSWNISGVQLKEIPGFAEFHPITEDGKELLPQDYIGIPSLTDGDLELNSRFVYKNLVTQMWDQKVREGR